MVCPGENPMRAMLQDIRFALRSFVRNPGFAALAVFALALGIGSNLLIGILLPPPGYNLEEFQAIGRQIESQLRPYWQAAPGSPEAAQLRGPLIRNFFYVARGRQIFMGVIARRPEEVRAMMPILRGVLGQIPGMIPIVIQASLFQRNLGEGRSIDVEITGPRLERLVQHGLKVFLGSRSLLPGAQVRGFGILLVDELNNLRIGAFKMGFWFAQQGSIYTFVVLIFVYVWLMNRLDKKHHFEEDE